jgi:hypothetical protein
MVEHPPVVPDAGKSGDIWDRVASLGEHWGDDDGDMDQDDEAYYKPGPARNEAREFAPDVPWEYVRELGLVKAFGQTVLQSILRPANLFSSLNAPHALKWALIFYLVVTALQTYLFQFWVRIFPSISLGFNLSPAHALYDSATPLYVVLVAPLVWLIFLAVVSAASLVILRLANGRNVSMSAVMCIMAYASTPMLLGVVPFIGVVLGQTWAMFLFMLGCKYAFHLKLFTVIVAFLPVYFCLAVIRIVLSGSF